MNQRTTLAQVQTSERFYRIPKALFEHEHYSKMKLESKVAYALLRDRFELSVKNGWVDKNGFVYLTYTVENLMKILGCGKNKVIAIKKELAEFNLLEEERVGYNKPNRIYVLNLDTARTFENQTTSEHSDSKEVSKSNHHGLENKPPEFQNQTTMVSKSNPNDTEYSDTNFNETDLLDEEEEVERKKNQIISEFGKSIGKSLISEAELNTEFNLKDITYFNQYLLQALDNAVTKHKKFNKPIGDFYIPMEGF